MPRYNADDIVEMKNRDKRKKRRIKFFAFLVIAALAAGLYFTREYWVSKIRGIGTHRQTIINDGELAEGNFPITINGGAEFQLAYTGKSPVILSDAYIYFYNDEGLLIKRRQHTYTNALLKTANGRALIFESGGDEFSVEDEDSIIYKDKFENNIIVARLSDEGYTAVVTTSSNYDCEIFVYDKKGNIIYERKCMEKVNDISFREESTGCVISFIDAENGSLVTYVEEITFTESEALWSSPAFDSFCFNIYSYDEGAFVLGIDACGYISNTGHIISYYSYEGELAGGDSSGGQSAVIVNNDDRRKYSAVLFDEGGLKPLTIDFEQPLTDVTVSDGLAFIMSQGFIRAYDFEGNLRSTVHITDSYTGFVRSEEYVFLKGYNKIDRIDYES